MNPAKGPCCKSFLTTFIPLVSWSVRVAPLLLITVSAFAQTPITVTLQQGVDAYEGVQDTWVSDFYRPERNQSVPFSLSFGAARELGAFERGPVGENARTLIRFDLSGVKGKIIGAELVLTKSAQSPNGDAYSNQTVAVYPITEANKDWQAGKHKRQMEDGAAFWNQKPHPVTPWAGAPGLASVGVDYTDNAMAIIPIGVELNVPIVFPLGDLAVLNGWAAHPECNAGFLIKEINSLKNGCNRFHSSEAVGDKEPFRPKLILKVVQ